MPQDECNDELKKEESRRERLQKGSSDLSMWLMKVPNSEKIKLGDDGCLMIYNCLYKCIYVYKETKNEDLKNEFKKKDNWNRRE